MTIHLLCPNCREPLAPESLTCPGGHRFGYEDGVLVLLEEEFGQQLRAFTAAFSEIRAAENKRLLDVSAYEELPFADAVKGDHEWRLRGYDLGLILELLGKRRHQRILDIGAWNGWLSHRLAGQGHDVTAIDYFTDEYDGLRARKFYSTTWRAIQMDVTDLSVLNESYDVVIVNRCLQFFPDPAAYVMEAKRKVAPAGLLILTGLVFFRDPSERIRGVAALRDHLNSHGLDFFKPIKGYLDDADKERLEAEGVILRRYPQLWLANLKSVFSKTSPRYYYGVFVAEINGSRGW